MVFGSTLVAAVLLGTPTVLAINKEYDGFTSIHNWGMDYTDMTLIHWLLPDGNTMQPTLTKDICSATQTCGAINQGTGDATYSRFRQLTGDDDFDVFLGITSAGVAPAAVCDWEQGGATFPGQQYLLCQTDLPFKILDTYPLPPDDIHKNCLSNPGCFAFRVKNDLSSGDILGVASGDYTMYFRGSNNSTLTSSATKTRSIKLV